MYIHVTFENSSWFTIYMQGLDGVKQERKLLVSGLPLGLSGVIRVYAIAYKLYK